MNITKKIIVLSAATLSSLLVVPAVASASADRPSGCRTYSTGRITCTSSLGGGSYSYNSFNPSSGYSSYGYRSSVGSSSYGYNSYSSPRSYGYSSYNSYGLGTGSRSTYSSGWNSYGGYWSNPLSAMNALMIHEMEHGC